MTKIRFITALLIAGIAAPAVAQDMSGIPGMPAQGQGGGAAQLVTTQPLGLTQNAWNSYLRNRGESKARPGYIRYVYDARLSYPIRTREGMITTIKMPEDEKLSQAFAGDEAGFQVALANEGSIVIKAIYPGVDTNVVAYGEDGRIYTFYVRSEGYQSKEISDFLVEIVRPGQEGQTADGAVAGGAYGSAAYGAVPVSENPASVAEAPYRNPSAVARTVRDPYATTPTAVNPKYREYAEWTDFNPNTIVEDLGVYVSRNMAGGTIPYRVFRDNRFTYIDYGPNAAQMTEWPSPQIVIQGVEGPVGNRTAGPGGRMIVIEALGEFVLRNGQRAIIVKPKASRTDPMLVEYPVASVGRMQVPTDLPPGQDYPQAREAQTVKPIMGAPATINGEAPSQIVALPDPQADRVKGKRGQRSKRVVTETVKAKVIPVAKGGGSPIVSAVTTRQTTTYNGSQIPAPGFNMGAVPGAVSAAPAVTSPYYVSLGTGSTAQLEDKWKSYKVQYYTDLSTKTVSYVPTATGTELRIMPVASAAEGIRLCRLMANEPNCSVKSAR